MNEKIYHLDLAPEEYDLVREAVDLLYDKRIIKAIVANRDLISVIRALEKEVTQE